ncbi:MAG: TRAP transporter TatT component family protein [Gammaproteobacteria bacterium]|nr:TRAP transporter TatT component family protein [Gammaproteobacteria bacterium]
MANLAGCSIYVSSASERFSRNLSSAILNQKDPETVKQGMPAYLLLVDSMIEGDPQNASLLFSGSRLYSSYAGVFVDDGSRSRNLSQKAWDLAVRGLCSHRKGYCQLHQMPYDNFEKNLDSATVADVESLYSYSVAWLGWIQAHSDDVGATSDLPKVTAIMEHIVKFEDSYDRGMVHLYLGVLSSLLPPALGGKPEVGRAHFEKAISLSKEKNLMAKVLYAERYARLVFDQDLHDRLLRSVLELDPEAPGFTLMNVVAKEKAQELLKSGKTYF